jgi:hypothetical protein
MNYFIKCILGISFFCTLQAKAQNNDLYVIKLKSGLVLKCELINVIPDSIVTIRQYGMISTLKFSEVISIDYSESLVKHEPPGSVPARQRKVIMKKAVPDSGWSVGLQPGFSMGIADGNWLTSSFVIKLSVLKSLARRWQAGVVVGLEPYAYYDLAMGTVMGEGRFYVEKEKPKSFFMHTQLGYGFNLTSERTGKDGGVAFSYGFGKSFRNRNQNIFSYMIGFKYQKAREEKIVWGPIGSVSRTYHYVIKRFEFKVEWRF